MKSFKALVSQIMIQKIGVDFRDLCLPDIDFENYFDEDFTEDEAKNAAEDCASDIIYDLNLTPKTNHRQDVFYPY
jgi:hypothetical protein